MAYDEKLAARIRVLLGGRPDVTERQMFGGLTFMVRGTHVLGRPGRHARPQAGTRSAADAFASRRARPMDFTGRALAGFVTVDTGALEGKALAEWLREAVAWADSLPPKQRE